MLLADLKTCHQLAQHLAAHPATCIDPVYVIYCSAPELRFMFDMQLLQNNYRAENQVYTVPLCPAVCLPACMSVCMYMHMSIFLPVFSYMCLPAYLTNSLLVHPLACLLSCLSHSLLL